MLHHSFERFQDAGMLCYIDNISPLYSVVCTHQSGLEFLLVSFDPAPVVDRQHQYVDRSIRYSSHVSVKG